MIKYPKHYRVIFRGKLRNKAGGLADYRIVLAKTKIEAGKKLKAMFPGNIKIDKVY